MKGNTVSKTFRINLISIKKIEDFAKSKNISQGKAIEKLINLADRYLQEKQLDKELNDLSNNENWMNENAEWSELDLN
ncbi:hypothetical protein GF354_01145 [Candidatus Peregrinibacteria bacterium]|nr:hypothetical protein [Candidatus Peregrinibacteria bacterium]